MSDKYVAIWTVVFVVLKVTVPDGNNVTWSSSLDLSYLDGVD